jgi:DNA-binding response OmpR family regulator
MVENKKKILIIEDEKPLAKALELKLNNNGYQAITVFNGEEALSLLKKEKFDLMLLDLVMPKMDGFGVLKKLQAMKNKTPVIILSNLSQEEDAKKTMELGAVDYFIKSDTPLAQVVESIKKYL